MGLDIIKKRESLGYRLGYVKGKFGFYSHSIEDLLLAHEESIELPDFRESRLILQPVSFTPVCLLCSDSSIDLQPLSDFMQCSVFVGGEAREQSNTAMSNGLEMHVLSERCDVVDGVMIAEEEL